MHKIEMDKIMQEKDSIFMGEQDNISPEKLDFRGGASPEHTPKEGKDLTFLQELEELLREKDTQQQETAREHEAQLQRIQADRKDLLDEIATWQAERERLQAEQESKLEVERIELQKEKERRLEEIAVAKNQHDQWLKEQSQNHKVEAEKLHTEKQKFAKEQEEWIQ